MTLKFRTLNDDKQKISEQLSLYIRQFFLFFLSHGQHDNGKICSKHFADLWTKHIFEFWSALFSNSDYNYVYVSPFHF